MSKPAGFIADSVYIGTCASPACRAVHIQLLDEHDHPHAQCSFSCEEIEELVTNLRTIRDRIVMGGANKGLDN